LSLYEFEAAVRECRVVLRRTWAGEEQRLDEIGEEVGECQRQCEEQRYGYQHSPHARRLCVRRFWAGYGMMECAWRREEC
jgi:hypothetical protein